MIKMRKNVFETNSSSEHSISFAKPEKNYVLHDNLFIRDGVLEIELGQFGWGIDWYNDPYTKLQYALTMVYSGETPYTDDGTWDKSKEAFYKTDGFNEIFNLLHKKYDIEEIKIKSFDGYIDHNSCYGSLDDFLNDYNVTLEDFIFNPNVILNIDNDNH